MNRYLNISSGIRIFLRIALTLLVILSANTLTRAEVRWAIEGDIGKGWLMGLPGHADGTVNYRIGPSAIIPIKGWTSLRPGIMWSHKGGVLEGYYGNEQLISSRIPISLDFIELPVLFAIRIPIGEKFGLTFKFGPYAGLGISGKTKVKGDDGSSVSMPGNLFSGSCDYYGNAQSSNKKKFELPKLNRWDIGLLYGIEFEFCRHYAVGFNLSSGLTRMVPKLLADNIFESIGQALLGQTHLRPFNVTASFTYIF